MPQTALADLAATLAWLAIGRLRLRLFRLALLSGPRSLAVFQDVGFVSLDDTAETSCSHSLGSDNADGPAPSHF